MANSFLIAPPSGTLRTVRLSAGVWPSIWSGLGSGLGSGLCLRLGWVLLGAALTSSAWASDPQQDATSAKDQPEDAQVVLNSTLDDRLFYQILAGEIAARNNEVTLGFRFLSAAAKSSGDALLYERAIQMAIQGGSGDAAWGAASQWVKAEPNSLKAQAMLLRVAIATKRSQGISDALTRIISIGNDAEKRDLIRAMPSTLKRLPSELATQAEAIADASLKQVKADPRFASSAWSAIGFLRLQAKNNDKALDALNKARNNDVADIDTGRLALALFEQGASAAEPVVLAHIAAQTNDPKPRFQYARLLYLENRTTAALAQLNQVLLSAPTLVPAWLLSAQIYHQQADFDKAQANAKQALILNAQQRASGQQGRADTYGRQAKLLLADVAQANGLWAESGRWLDEVGSEDEAVLYRRAVLLGKQGREDEAIALIQGPALTESPAENASDADADAIKSRMQLTVRLLREFKRLDDAYLATQAMIAAFPDDAELLYGQAMLADQLGRPAEMERLLRELIQREPDYEHAYNALGYSLVDRGERLQEAQALIEKALTLSPNDPLITDSLGWAYFRQGRLDLAAQTLERAYAIKQDPEIAAHLGEVRWVQGKTAVAIQLVREAIARYPDNAVLKATVKRLGMPLQ